MTSRERVLLAIDHKPTDRAPADYEAHQEVSDRLMLKIGVTDMEELLNYLHVDMRRTGILHDTEPMPFMARRGVTSFTRWPHCLARKTFLSGCIRNRTWFMRLSIKLWITK